MPLFLDKRNEHLSELMDQPNCDTAMLFNTYRQFKTINRLISGWHRIYKQFIKPTFSEKDRQYSILDIGCGGGDIMLWLDTLTKKDGFNVTFTGIEPDQRAIDFLMNLDQPDNIKFMKSSSYDLVEKNFTFDIVISNHLMHHLAPSELKTVCEHASKLASRKIIFSDIERSDAGYAAFKLLATPFFHNSFIVPDGLTSIRRSFRKAELLKILPDRWTVRRQFPFRLLAIYDSS